MVGIYYCKNKITNKYYIGQSIDIQRRINTHKKEYLNSKNNKVLYESIRTHGIENFEWGIIEECLVDELDDKEIYWIKYYNSYSDGYNATSGEQNEYTGIGENNGRTKLTNKDVLDIRNRVYNNNEDIWVVYVDYCNLVGKDRFWSLVHGETWKNVDTSMIYSLKDRGYKNFSGSKNPKAKLTENDVKNIRFELEVNKKTREEVFDLYKDKISYSAFLKVVRYNTWKDIKY